MATAEKGEKKSGVDLDTILINEVGQFGRYQLITLALAAFPIMFSAFAAGEYIFTTARIDTRCLIPQCDGANPEFAPSWVLNAIPGESQTSFDGCSRYVNSSQQEPVTQGTCPANLFDRTMTQECDGYVYENTLSVVYDMLVHKTPVSQLEAQNKQFILLYKFLKNFKQKQILCVFLVASYIVAGTFLFKQWEQWAYLDAAYFCFITLTTIGFGDFVPAQGQKADDAAAAVHSIALCSLYLLFGIALLAMSFNLVQEEVRANVASLATKLGIIKPRDSQRSDESDY